VAVSVTNVTARARCPSGPIHIDQDVQFDGDFVVSAKNSGAASATVTVKLTVRDSDGHSKTDTEYFGVDAGGQETKNYTSFLTASYDAAGRKTVTAQVQADAANSKTASDDCSFNVT